MLHDVANVKTTGRLPQDRVTKSRGRQRKQKSKKQKNYETLNFKTSKQVFYELFFLNLHLMVVYWLTRMCVILNETITL